MTSLRSWVRTLVRSIADAWSARIPPHSYALLRIVLGVMGLLSLAGLTPVEMFWPLDGVTPLSSDGTGPRAWLLAHGFGTIAGWVLFVALAGVFTLMTLGIYSDAAVLAAFLGLVFQSHWNTLPLSSAHQVLTVLVFCLAWANTGGVWALRPSPSEGDGLVPAWPLQLMRFQVGLIYASTALWKLSFPVWRDGSAVHWALNLNVFRRVPWVWPQEAVLFPAFLTWGTVLFELLFPLLVLFRKTRPWVLVAGVGLHLGLWLSLELGPFSWLMVASYIAFLNPWTTPKLFHPKDKLPPV